MDSVDSGPARRRRAPPRRAGRDARSGHPGPHDVLHQPVHPNRVGLAVDQRQPQQLAQCLLQLQLARLEPGQRGDRDRVRSEEGDRLQQLRGLRRPHGQPVERQPPGGGDRPARTLDVAQQQPVAVAAEQVDVVGQRDPRSLDVGARLLQRERQVAEQLGESVGLDGPVAGAGRDIGQRLAPGQRPDRDRVGDAPPGRVARGDDHVAVPGRGAGTARAAWARPRCRRRAASPACGRARPTARPGRPRDARTGPSPARPPARRARWRCRPGLRRRSTRRRGRAGAAGGPAPVRARSSRPRPDPVSATARGRRVSSSRVASTAASRPRRPTNDRFRGGRWVGRAVPPTPGRGSWASTAARTWRRAGVGSTPSSSARARLAAVVGGQRIGLPAGGVERRTSWTATDSRSGSRAASSSSSATSSAARP